MGKYFSSRDYSEWKHELDTETFSKAVKIFTFNVHIKSEARERNEFETFSSLLLCFDGIFVFNTDLHFQRQNSNYSMELNRSWFWRQKQATCQRLTSVRKSRLTMSYVVLLDINQVNSWLNANKTIMLIDNWKWYFLRDTIRWFYACDSTDFNFYQIWVKNCRSRHRNRSVLMIAFDHVSNVNHHFT